MEEKCTFTISTSSVPQDWLGLGEIDWAPDHAPRANYSSRGWGSERGCSTSFLRQWLGKEQAWLGSGPRLGRPPVMCHSGVQNCQTRTQKGTKVRVRTDVLKPVPGSKELDTEEESGSRLEEPVGTRETVHPHGHCEMAPEVLPGQREGFSPGL